MLAASPGDDADIRHRQEPCSAGRRKVHQMSDPTRFLRGRHLLISLSVALMTAACAGRELPRSPSSVDANPTFPAARPSANAPASSVATRATDPAPSQPSSARAPEIATVPALSPSPTVSPTAVDAPPSQRNVTARPSSPLPTRTPTQAPPSPTSTPPPAVGAGEIAFTPDDTYAPGELASWRATFTASVGSSEVLWMLIERLTDGREFEHWRESVVIDDPSCKTLSDQRDLWIYAHNGAGTYVMRYQRADGSVLAEGTLRLVP